MTVFTQTSTCTVNTLYWIVPFEKQERLQRQGVGNPTENS